MQKINGLYLILVTFLLTFLLHSGDSAKILFFFAGGTYSHKVSVWPFVVALADKGHNVTLITAFSKKPFDHPGVTDLAPGSMAESMGKQFGNRDRLQERQQGLESKVWTNYHQDVLTLCDAIFSNIDKDADLYRLFYNETYDLMINNVVFGDCGYVIAHRLMTTGNTKLILYDSTFVVSWFPDLYGFPAETSWIPEAANIKDYPMNFIERFGNYFQPLYWYWTKQWELLSPLAEVAKRMYGLEKAPSLLDIEKNASLIFVATHYSTDYGRSLPPFVVNIGGMQNWQTKKSNSLGEFQEFLDTAENGAILIAFGSTIDLSKIPAQFKNMFFEMMSKFPEIRFILRWDGALPENVPNNIKISKWLPQAEILGHKNLKAFISHAGLNSLTEATFYGVPVILLPLFADQDYNGYRVQAYELGIRLEVRTLSTKVMENAVREILTNNKYSTNMKKMSQMMRDRPMNPIETAVWWTEFVLRHEDTSPLKPLNYLNFFQRRHLDVLFLAAFLFSLLILTSAWLTCKLCKKTNTRVKNANVKNQNQSSNPNRNNNNNAGSGNKNTNKSKSGSLVSKKKN